MGNNGMALVRANQRTIDTIQTAINPFMSRAMSQAGIDATMFLRCAAQQLEGVDFDIRTLGPALVTFAMAGLLPNKSLGHGYLIPFKKKGVGIVTPVFGYKGLIELATRAKPPNGAVLCSKRFDVVLDYEDFAPDELGIDEACRRHVPSTDRNPNKDACYDAVLYAYAQFTYAVNVGGIVHTYHETELMGKGDIEASRRMSKARSGPWHDWPIRMAQRVPVRRLCASGRVPLGYYPGAALAAEGAADVGNFSDYLAKLSGASMGAGTAKAMAAALDGGMEAVADDAPQATGLDAYLADVADMYEDLKHADRPDDVRAIVSQMKKTWTAHMGDAPFKDDQADRHLERVGLK